MTEPAGWAPTRASLLAVAGMMAAAAAGLAAWSGGFGARVGGPDLYAYFLAKQAYVAETIRAGHLPLWNPYEFCGLPLLGTAQGSALYAPVVLANMALSATAAMQVLYDLHIAAYILLTLVYLTRRGHGLPSAGVAAALATAGVFRGAAGAGIDHPPFLFSVTYLPAVLLAWDGIGARRPGAEALLALLAGVQWLPGYPEFPLETAVVLVLVAALEPAPGALRRVGLAGVLLALGALVAAVQILPTAETVAESTRGDYPEQLKLARLLFAMHGPWQLVNVSLWRLGGGGVVCLVLGLPSAHAGGSPGSSPSSGRCSRPIGPSSGSTNCGRSRASASLTAGTRWRPSSRAASPPRASSAWRGERAGIASPSRSPSASRCSRSRSARPTSHGRWSRPPRSPAPPRRCPGSDGAA